MTKTFKANSTAGVIAIGESNTIDQALADPSSYLSDLTFHSSLSYLQLRAQTITIGSASFDSFPQEYINWNDGGCDCFTANTRVTLPDGSTKAIVDIKVGDLVLGSNGKANKVTFIEKVPDTLWEYLYSPEQSIEPFATVNHPLYIDDKLKAIDPIAVYNLYPWLGKPEPLDGYVISPATGNYVYNLWLTGDGTYIVNGYKTTSIMFTGHFLSYCFDKNWLTQQQVLTLLTYFTEQGKYVQYGAYLINKFLYTLKSMNFILKPIALNLNKQKSITRIIISKIGKLIGYALHPNR